MLRRKMLRRTKADKIHAVNPALTMTDNSQNAATGAMIDNPHWIVEVSYDAEKYTPTEVGKQCSNTLASYRQKNNNKDFTVMALGGVKRTPSTSPPPSLQTGEWGVDVVEARDPNMFLEEINWDHLSGAKPAEDIFRIDCAV